MLSRSYALATAGSLFNFNICNTKRQEENFYIVKIIFCAYLFYLIFESVCRKIIKKSFERHFMQEITGVISQTSTPYSEFKNHVGEVVTIKGAIHNIRDMSDFAFIIVRTARELIQCVYSPEFSDYRLTAEVTEQCSAKITGKVVKSETRDGSERFELQIHNIELLSVPAAIPPVVISKKQVNCELSVNLDYRPVTLRNPK